MLPADAFPDQAKIGIEAKKFFIVLWSFQIAHYAKLNAWKKRNIHYKQLTVVNKTTRN